MKNAERSVVILGAVFMCGLCSWQAFAEGREAGLREGRASVSCAAEVRREHDAQTERCHAWVDAERARVQAERDLWTKNTRDLIRDLDAYEDDLEHCRGRR